MLNDNDLSRIRELKEEHPELHYLFDALEMDHKTTLSYISHELRNTLTLIISSMQFIETSHPEAASFKYWNETMNDMHYMKGLLISLSDYNNSQKLKFHTIDLKSLAQQIFRSCHSLAKARNIKFQYSGCDAECIIKADPVKLQQALINLLKNAIESVADEGTVSMDINSADHSCTITIADNGCGMSEEELQTVYTPFVTTKKEGTGLGLPITRRIIENHNGSMKIQSEPGKGTIITISLPSN